MEPSLLEAPFSRELSADGRGDCPHVDAPRAVDELGNGFRDFRLVFDGTYEELKEDGSLEKPFYRLTNEGRPVSEVVEEQK